MAVNNCFNVFSGLFFSQQRSQYTKYNCNFGENKPELSLRRQTFSVGDFTEPKEILFVLIQKKISSNKVEIYFNNKNMTQQGISVISIKQPSKVLHFSDGILEIFDDEEETKAQTKDEVPEINEVSFTQHFLRLTVLISVLLNIFFQKELDWTPWFIYKAQRLGRNVINGLDYTGEKIADFLNITSPKYAYEIQQYKKDLAKKAKEEEILKANTWKIQPESPGCEPITKPPQSTDMKF